LVGRASKMTLNPGLFSSGKATPIGFEPTRALRPARAPGQNVA
jgi:hypothetical protein